MVSAASITHNNKILLFQRDDIPTIIDPNKWDLIGGHIDEGETPDQAIVREIKEEIGIEVNKLKLIKKLFDSWGAETHLYHIELSKEEAKKIKLGDEGQAIKFHSFPQMTKLKLTQNLRLYLKEFSSEIKHIIQT